MRLTNKAREDLRYVLRNAERTLAFINQKETVIHLDGVRVNKQYGSDIEWLRAAIFRLSHFIVTH